MRYLHSMLRACGTLNCIDQSLVEYQPVVPPMTDQYKPLANRAAVSSQQNLHIGSITSVTHANHFTE
jgi:hypothetical protein